MRGQPGHNTRPYVQFPPSLPGMDAWMALQLNVAFIHQLSRHLRLFRLFFDVIHGCLYNQTLTDVQSTGAGIKYLYCSNHSLLVAYLKLFGQCWLYVFD